MCRRCVDGRHVVPLPALRYRRVLQLIYNRWAAGCRRWQQPLRGLAAPVFQQVDGPAARVCALRTVQPCSELRRAIGIGLLGCESNVWGGGANSSVGMRTEHQICLRTSAPGLHVARISTQHWAHPVVTQAAARLHFPPRTTDALAHAPRSACALLTVFTLVSLVWQTYQCVSLVCCVWDCCACECTFVRVLPSSATHQCVNIMLVTFV